MIRKNQHISVFEHQALHIDRGDQRLNPSQLKALQRFYGADGVPYYSLIHNGVKFNEYVGVLNIGNTTVEVLPKADKTNNTEMWRQVLISMLHSVGIFDIHAPSKSELNLRSNSILDLYFELFIKDVEYLFRRGLIKKYRKIEGNRTSLKGNIQFAKHINQNLVHKERFYVKHYTYDAEHELHGIIFKTLKLIARINTNNNLRTRLGSLILDFPDQKDIRTSEELFDRISYNRKTEPYRNSIEIARLILLNYHPDINRGDHDVLALMFDMNRLWEEFVHISLKKHKQASTTITAQNTRNFWKSIRGNRSKMKPDIILNKGQKDCIVLDTKWKNLNGYNPTPDDLRQMFVYHKYFGAKKVALVYPGDADSNKSGYYYSTVDSNELSEKECSLISIGVDTDLKTWQKTISQNVEKWIA